MTKVILEDLKESYLGLGGNSVKADSRGLGMGIQKNFLSRNQSKAVPQSGEPQVSLTERNRRARGTSKQRLCLYSSHLNSITNIMWKGKEAPYDSRMGRRDQNVCLGETGAGVLRAGGGICNWLSCFLQ